MVKEYIYFINLKIIILEAFILIENSYYNTLFQNIIFSNFTLQQYFIKILSNNIPLGTLLFQMQNVSIKLIDKPKSPSLVYIVEGFLGNVSFENTVWKNINTGIVEGFFHAFSMEKSYVEIEDGILLNRITTPLFYPQKFDYFSLKSIKFIGSSEIASGSVNYSNA